MSCMCGDICCSSCGPAQGNWKCPICNAWASEACEHMSDECTCGHPLSAHEHGIGDDGDWCGKIACDCRGYNAVGGLKAEFHAEAEAIAKAEADADAAYARDLIDEEALAEAYWRRDERRCDCIASGNPNKPKQHGADPHAKDCRVYREN